MSQRNSSQPTEITARIHHLLQDFYLFRRKIRVSYQVGNLGISESQILVQTFAEPGLSAKRLTEVLHLEKSTISRMISSLVEKGHLRTEVSAGDSREKEIFVTASGTEMVQELQESNNQILQACLKNLTVREQYDLAHRMKLLADGLDCFPATYLPGDHPITLEIVRLGRGTGMTGHHFMRSEYSSTQYHFLRELQLRPESGLSDVQKHLPFDASTLTRTLASLRERKLVESSDGKSKRSTARGANFVLSKEGVKVVAEIDKKASELFQGALSTAPADTAVKLEQLLQKVVHVSEGSGTKILQERVEVREILSLEERQLARGLLLDQLIRANKHFETPDEMYSPKNKCFGLFRNDDLIGACEAIYAGSDWQLMNFTTVPHTEKNIVTSFEATLKQFLRTRSM